MSAAHVSRGGGLSTRTSVPAIHVVRRPESDVDARDGVRA